ncbi:MAG: rRNA pseudouridine synthase, partial [Deltaproteobacteria bacterium]|nr:rRNA pseudouridine synthase [Deltaproteobacteria bacterium]
MGLRKGHVSLERALSKLGLASRTQARALILAGEVMVNGRTVRDPGFKVVPERAKITIGDTRAKLAAPLTILLNKPRGVVTTRSDEKGRPTVYSLLTGLGVHVIPVGRLDLATSGLLLLTNDTQFSAWITDPVNKVPRSYVVTVRGEVTGEVAEKLRAGIRDEGELLHASALAVRKSSGRESHLVIELVEGKNREIRRLMLAAGHEVTRLKRISFGGLGLG